MSYPIPRLLNPDDIEVRIQQCKPVSGSRGGYRTILLLYKTARTDMAILDETFGPLNWSNSYQEIKGHMYCTISVRDPDTGEWVSKTDCGTESNTEAEKGEASDAFKRAGTRWGIGRELYTGPIIVLFTNDEQKYQKYTVTHVGYDEKRNITSLEVADQKSGAVVFQYGMGRKPHAQQQPSPFDMGTAWKQTVELVGSEESAKEAWLGTGIKSSKEMTGERFLALYKRLKAEKENGNG